MTSTTGTHASRQPPAAALVVFLVITCIAAAVLYRTRDRLLGVSEDHFDKGVSLHETGSMLATAEPNVFRPPGYPVFVAAILELREAAMIAGRAVFGELVPQGLRLVAVLASHAALLGLLGVSVFSFAKDRAGPFVATACAVAVGCNPLLLILAGHVSYELLHLVLVTIATLLLLKHVGGNLASSETFGNGLVWGAVTLVKSVTLIAPAFILLWASLHYGVRSASKTTALFTAGLLLVVAPYTVRNYVVAGRFIPVNEQASFALWATSLERIPPGADYLHWVNIWHATAMKTFTEVTGATDYSLVKFEEHVLELSDRFALMTRDNLRRDPSVYAYNVLRNGVTFITDSPNNFYFQRYRWPFESRFARLVAALSLGLMTLVAVVALIVGSLQRDRRWTLLFALFAMMWAAHAMTFLEPRYLYVKLPTIVAAFVLACAVASSEGQWRWRQGAVSVATLSALLSLAGLLTL